MTASVESAVTALVLALSGLRNVLATNAAAANSFNPFFRLFLGGPNAAITGGNSPCLDLCSCLAASSAICSNNCKHSRGQGTGECKASALHTKQEMWLNGKLYLLALQIPSWHLRGHSGKAQNAVPLRYIWFVMLFQGVACCRVRVT